MKTHGRKGTPEYRSWGAMRTRCNNPNIAAYYRYGGCGITVCDRWDKFENFLADMGPRPSLSHTLDRIDPHGNYEPGNVRWATKKMQGRNRRNTAWITAYGTRMSLGDWAEAHGLSEETIRWRVTKGWSPEASVAPRFTDKDLEALS